MLVFAVVAADRRRKNVHGKALVGAIAALVTVAVFLVLTRTVFAGVTALAAIATLIPIAALISIAAVIAVATLTALALRAGFGLNLDTVFARRVDQLFVAVFIVVEILATLAALIFEACTIFAQDAEIVIGELQVIFALDAVAGELRVAGHALVLFEQLRRIAALPVILAVSTTSGLSPEVLSPLSPASAPAAALTIIDQILDFPNQKLPPFAWVAGLRTSGGGA